jgi:mannan endo-1,4-beta-mannosidase
VAAASAGFSIQGTSIIGPDGKTFLPLGANLNGQDEWWSDSILGQSGKALAWGWNTVRLNTCYAGGCPASVDGCGSSCDYNQSPYLDQAISEYTGKAIVTIVEQHQYTGADSTLCGSQTKIGQLKQWWVDMANRYKGNPYVWFNVLNEPVGDNNLTCWQQDVQPVVAAIRATGANNIIVLDGSAWGQDLNDWSCDGLPYQNSAIVNNVPGLEAQYGNILPSVHMYSDWGGGSSGCTQQQLETRWHTYLNHVHSLGLPLIVGETGDNPGCTNTSDAFPDQGQCSAAVVAFDCTRQFNVGLVYWHGADPLAWLVKNGGFEDINSNANPTNLTRFSGYAIPGGGQSLWNLGHGWQPSCSG